MSTRILVAEDDDHIRDGLVDTLESEGYQAVPAADGRAALERAEAEDFDLVILDIMMPEVNGYDVCRAIRKTDSQTPVIMLTAKGEEIDKVLGLELGADDYVTKPFGLRELLARISAVLRRARNDARAADAPARFAFGAATIDRRALRGELDGSTFDLTAREMELIKIFHQHTGEALSREDLLKMAWDVDYGSYTRTLDQHIAQLRKKVESDPGHPTAITTVYGVGYRYEGEV